MPPCQYTTDNEPSGGTAASCQQLPQHVASQLAALLTHQVDLACRQEPLASLEYSGYCWLSDVPLLPLLLLPLVVVLLLMPAGNVRSYLVLQIS